MNAKFQVWSEQHAVQDESAALYYRFFTFIRVRVGHFHYNSGHMAFNWYWINCWLKFSRLLKNVSWLYIEFLLYMDCKILGLKSQPINLIKSNYL